MAISLIRVLTEAIIGKEEEEESTFSMTRLRERGIVRGEGAQVTLRGDSQRISTQLLTGVMSITGLKSQLEMIKGRGPAYRTYQSLYTFDVKKETRNKLHKENKQNNVFAGEDSTSPFGRKEGEVRLVLGEVYAQFSL
jgi:hypothetical protein